MIRQLIAAVAATLALAAPARAEVVDSGDTVFVVEIERPSTRTPADLWQRLQHPESWWSSAHTWSGDAANMSLAMEAGGCWCERVGDGVVVHGRIIRIDGTSGLLLDAPLGPLSDAAVATRLSWRIITEGGTRVRLRYEVAGRMPLPTHALAPLVDQVLTQQIDTLVAP